MPWSISDPGAFWSALWDFADVIGNKGDVSFLPDAGARMTGARFFPKARLNLAENLLRGAASEPVVHAVCEAGFVGSLTRAELRDRVARAADGLCSAGVRPGDRVAGVLPNTPEALVALLVTLAVGGV